MLSLSEFQIALSPQFTTPPFTLALDNSSHYLVAGKNQAGKSVLLRALAGKGKTISGHRSCDVTIFDISINTQQALIEQEKQKDSADILDVIATPTQVRELLSNVNPNYEQHHLFGQLCQTLQLEHLLDSHFLSLSTGETRKVIILMAWLSQATLILLDEPFEGLDAQSAEAFGHFLVNQQQAQIVMSANKRSDIPYGLKAKLIVMENLAITWQSPDSLDFQTIYDHLSTWFALGLCDVTLPSTISLHQKDFSGHAQNTSDDVLIQLNDGYVRYDDRTVFKDLTFTLRRNQHWQISGPNGSGKTCLLHMFTGDNPHCYTNDLTLFGITRGSGESIWDIKKHIGIMSNALHMQYTYKTNVSLLNVIISGFHDSIGLYVKASPEERQCALRWLSLLGLAEKENTPFLSLSFGEQRLALIARSMVKHPTVLILDEPCNGLDDFNRQKVLKLIDVVAQHSTTTLLYVTHNQSESVPSIQHHLDMRDYQA